jgi:hypothetical protein
MVGHRQDPVGVELLMRLDDAIHYAMFSGHGVLLSLPLAQKISAFLAQQLTGGGDANG